MTKSRKLAINIVLAAGALAALMPAAFSDPDTGEKGVICHATGSAKNPFVGVVVGVDTSGPVTIFSSNGHLDANGSPESGHEQDIYIGPSPPNTKQDCPGGTEPSPTPKPTPTPEPK